MTEPIVIAALISLIGVETAAFLGYFLRRNNKKNNPGPLQDILVLLTAMNTKLDELLRRK